MTINPELFLSSPAREKRLIAYIEAIGAEAMQICAERGVSVGTFSNSHACEIFSAAEYLHNRRELMPDSAILAETVLVSRKSVPADLYFELTSEAAGKLGIAKMEVPTLCAELRRLEKLRTLARTNTALADALRSADDERITQALGELSSSDTSSKPRATWHQTGGVALDRAKAIIAGTEDPDVRSIFWPWHALDVGLKPFRRGELVIVAGYTSNGKSSMLRQLCTHSARAGHNVAIVSLEVPASDIFTMIASAHAGRSFDELKAMHGSDQADYLQAAQQVRGMSIEVLDDESTLPAILAWLRNQHARRFLDVIAIDYLGLIAECSPERGQTKAAAVGEVAGALKRLAHELQCVLLLAVQINRGPTTDGNREPRLSDLKDSGDIEAHADRVLLLYRPSTDKASKTKQDAHQSVADRPRYYIELLQEKGRNVGTGSFPMWLRRDIARFELIGRTP